MAATTIITVIDDIIFPDIIDPLNFSLDTCNYTETTNDFQQFAPDVKHLHIKNATIYNIAYWVGSQYIV